MNQMQFNDQMLAYEIRRLNGSLQEAFQTERDIFGNAIQQLQNQLEQAEKDKASLYMSVDEANALVAQRDRLVTKLWAALSERATQEEMDTVQREYESDERQRAAAFDAAIAPQANPDVAQ